MTETFIERGVLRGKWLEFQVRDDFFERGLIILTVEKQPAFLVSPSQEDLVASENLLILCNF